MPQSLPEQAPQGHWSGAEGAWVLRLSGEWSGHRAGLAEPPPALRQRREPARLTVDAGALRSWDARLASSLWQRLVLLNREQVQIDLGGLPAGLEQILSRALEATPPAALPSPGASSLSAPAPPPMAEPRPTSPTDARLRRRLPGWVTSIGRRAAAWWADGRASLGFFGEVLLCFGRLLRGRTDMRASDLAWQIEQTGPRSVPIVSLVSFLVGLIVAYMGAAQLERFGAQTYIADLVTVGVVREMAALMVGIVLAGRVGAAFAAQIGSMRANEEVDALSTLGVNPFDHLVLPRVLALLIVGPLLTAFAALVGMGVGWLVAVAIYGVTPLEYLVESAQALTLPHMLIGLLKGTIYAALVALAGCRQGMAAGRSAQAVGDATTAAVVQAIVWMVVAASVLTVIFQRLDW